jgi:parvulin-like peptidyl-prolyl isomerase
VAIGQEKTATPAPAKGAAAGDTNAAVVNGEPILHSEVDGHLASLGVPPGRRDALRGQVLQSMIDNTLLVQLLESEKTEFDQAFVDATVSQLRKKIEAQGVKMDQALGQFGLSEAKIRRQLVAQSRWTTYVKQHVNDEQRQQYLKQHQDEFDGTEVRASHILVQVPRDASADKRSAARARIKNIQKELASGRKFDELARMESDCPSREQGGDLGSFPRRGAMVEPFAAAAFALKVGATSEVVETEFGYHLIRVTERKPGKPVQLADVQEQVNTALGEHLKDTLVAQQRKAAKVEITTPAKKSAPPAPKK